MTITLDKIRALRALVGELSIGKILISVRSGTNEALTEADFAGLRELYDSADELLAFAEEAWEGLETIRDCGDRVVVCQTAARLLGEQEGPQ
jgi:hypothetical protein